MKKDPSILSIRELIDKAFGESNLNVVNHKLIQTVLIILARQLRLLERRVEIEMAPQETSSSTSLSVTEVKLHANVPRKIKAKSHDAAGASGHKVTIGATKSKSSMKSGTLTPSSAKVTSKASYDKTSSSATKSTTDKSSSDQTKSSSDKTSTGKSSSGITSSATKSSTDKSSSGKTSTTKTSTTKTSTTKTSTTKTSSGDKTSSDKTSSAITSSAITSSDKTSTDKTSTDKSSSEIVSSDVTTTETTKSSSEKKTTSEETKSSTYKTSSDSKTSTEPHSTLKTTTEKSLSGKPSKVSAKLSSQDYMMMLEMFEEQREQELRIIHQRTDSHEEHAKTPTPIASMESTERQYEKLLIVERVPSGTKTVDTSARGKTPHLSVVTQEEFAQLATTVRQLQDRFQISGVSGPPENTQLLNDLRKGASLTDAMAALQLSARVEDAEKALGRLMAVITEIIKRIYVVANIPSLSIDEFIKKIEDSEEDLEEVIYQATSAISQAVIQRKSVLAPKKSIGTFQSAESMTFQVDAEQQDGEGIGEGEGEGEAEGEPVEKPDSVTYEELDNALQELYDECYKLVNTATTKSNKNANAALKVAHRLEGRLDESLNLGDRMFNLEKIFTDYADKINTLDTGLSSQMTTYQEQLTQMQHDLEAGLEAMAEALANTGGDTAAVGELNNHFTNLQTDLDIAASRQKELKDMQNVLSMDLQGLWKHIEILRDHKSDRDEVADALKDKAGLAALNGLVSRQEFDAVRGDFEKRIGLSYDKFNNQEIIWQKAIDDLIRELNEKADWIQVLSLQGSINQYLDKFRAQIRAMEEVVGEPRASSVTRKLHREAECLCCATPAHMDLEESKPIPLLPAFPASRASADGAEAKSKPKGDGDHGDICYPGMPVTHGIDSRAHVCHRYCGGSHTMINKTLTRAPMGMIVTPALRKFNTALGTDGKLYMVDDKIRKPCIPCYKRTTTTPEPSEAEPGPHQEEFVSDMMSFDYRPSSMLQTAAASDVVSYTPPPPMNDEK